MLPVDIESSVPEELIVPALPDWNAIVDAVEYDPEADGYPRYSFDLPVITDTPPAYESTVTRLREQLHQPHRRGS